MNLVSLKPLPDPLAFLSTKMPPRSKKNAQATKNAKVLPNGALETTFMVPGTSGNHSFTAELITHMRLTPVYYSPSKPLTVSESPFKPRGRRKRTTVATTDQAENEASATTTATSPVAAGHDTRDEAPEKEDTAA